MVKAEADAAKALQAFEKSFSTATTRGTAFVRGASEFNDDDDDDDSHNAVGYNKGAQKRTSYPAMLPPAAPAAPAASAAVTVSSFSLAPAAGRSAVPAGFSTEEAAGPMMTSSKRLFTSAQPGATKKTSNLAAFKDQLKREQEEKASRRGPVLARPSLFFQPLTFYALLCCGGAIGVEQWRESGECGAGAGARREGLVRHGRPGHDQSARRQPQSAVQRNNTLRSVWRVWPARLGQNHVAPHHGRKGARFS